MSDPNDPWVIAEKTLQKGRDYINSQKREEWEITSDDGLKLWGAFYPSYDENGNISKKVVLMMHGYRSFFNNDFAVSFKYIYENGYSILLPNQRAHDKSEGKYICYGIKERYDCKKWCEEIVQRLGSEAKISLMGVSMGCATVTMALGLDLPSNVKCSVSDCGFTSPWDEFKYILNGKYHLPDFPFMYAHRILCKLIAKFDTKGCSTLDVLKIQKRPVLFISGGKDNFVPTKMTYANYDACTAEKELLIIDNATHAQSFLTEPEKCAETVNAFLAKHLK